MFGLFRGKKLEIVSPVSGEVIDLATVEDEVFSQKMLGDGIAVLPESGLFVAPVEGVVSKLFKTRHAYVVRHDSGVEVMVHIGLDTVDLKGEGFKAIVEEGDHVKAGDPLIEADLDRIESLGKKSVTPVIVSETGKFKTLVKESGFVTAAEKVMELK